MITIKNRYTGEVILEIESLQNADLRYANLRYANLSDADLSGANLSYTDLSDADLSGANLSYTDLSGANLSYADLSYADLRYANLSDADLSGANLHWCVGNMQEIRSAQFDTYMVTWSKDTLAIGCQQHPIEAWWDFDDNTIAGMDTDAITWWKKWKPILKQLIEMSA